MSLPAEFFSQSAGASELRDPKTSGTIMMQVDPEELIWKKELANATTSAANLLEKLELGHHIQIADNKPDFKCLVTDSYIYKMQLGNINDPLLRQVLPLNQENNLTTQYHGAIDPVGDKNNEVSQGLLHKYHGRALLISTGACAIHCRYCFRRCYPYQQSSCTGKAVNDAIEYLNSHREVEEIILSGGDPLTLDNEKLAGLISALESIKHVQTLRIHTRLPVVLPNRVNHGLLDLLRSSRFQIVVVIHANHANEL
ncbi:MAG: 4Fe-4S cluster-binding domain-containing protein, partial [Gammaproteobacteria bacterium]|nr:4Fe-4S cluster-binding domain-containing protein [Gammaproteobacteria bacterium]